MVDNRYNPYKGLSDRCVESLMPKGVEHSKQFVGRIHFKVSVESLMPKGVEHRAAEVTGDALKTCGISDAERRGALTTQGSDPVAIAVLNLGCRKALSTSSCNRRSRWHCCVESLMPKGVEHRFDGCTIDRFGNSVESLMPKGVEHQNISQTELLEQIVLNLGCRKALSTSRSLHHTFSLEVLNLGCRKALSTYGSRFALYCATVLNLGCRKALSTKELFEKRYGLFRRVESLMPKGVEHTVKGGNTEELYKVLNLGCRKALSTQHLKT